MKTSKLPRKKTSHSRSKSSRGEKKKPERPKLPLHFHEPTREYVDWIDEKGKKLGEVDKFFAHHQGMLHYAAHVFVFDSEKRMILQFRAHEKKIYPKLWDTSVGGHVLAGEDIEVSTRREMGEELGVRMKPHYLGWADVWHKEGDYNHAERIHYHYVILPRHYQVKPNEEFEDIAFKTLKEMPAFIRKHKFTPSFLVGWKKFHKTLQRRIK